MLSGYINSGHKNATMKLSGLLSRTVPVRSKQKPREGSLPPTTAGEAPWVEREDATHKMRRFASPPDSRWGLPDTTDAQGYSVRH